MIHEAVTSIITLTQKRSCFFFFFFFSFSKYSFVKCFVLFQSACVFFTVIVVVVLLFSKAN